MLYLSRRPGESIFIQPRPDLDPATPVRELFAEAPIVLRVSATTCTRVNLGIAAHSGLSIVREELIPRKFTDFLDPEARLELAVKREGVLERISDLESVAAALNVTTTELLRPPGSSIQEREVMMRLEPVT
jgi:sRNA-binding carbon storage regulator CsrA